MPTLQKPTMPNVGCAMRTVNGQSNHNKMAGFSYVEVLVATVLIAVTLVPAIEAFSSGINSTGYTESLVEDRYQLTAKLEEVLADSFADIDTAATVAGSPTIDSSYRDIVTYPDGRQITRNVFLSRYDGDNADADNDPFTGIDAGLIWIRVEIDGTSLNFESLISDSN